MIPAKPLDPVIFNTKYRLGKYYVEWVCRVCRDFSNPLPRNPYVINEWPLRSQNLIIEYRIDNYCYDDE